MRLLIFTVLLVFAATAPVAAPAAGNQTQNPARIELAPDVQLLPGEFVPGQQPDGNSLLFQAPQGLVVFDTGRHLRQSTAILDAARSLDQPLLAIINSHWHLDHVSGNPLLRKRFPELKVHASMAIEEALSGFLANYRKQLEQQLARTDLSAATRQQYQEETVRIDAGRALLPDVPVLASGIREIAGRTFELGLETHAVTAADVWLLDRQSGILAAGDLLTFPAPFFDTACPARWQQALGRIEQAEFRVLVPGHGPPLDRAGVVRYRRAFDGLLACASGKATPGQCGAVWIRGLGDLLPTAQHKFAASMIEYYVTEVLRKPPAGCESM